MPSSNWKVVVKGMLHRRVTDNYIGEVKWLMDAGWCGSIFEVGAKVIVVYKCNFATWQAARQAVDADMITLNTKKYLK